MKKVQITETVLRDANQSLMATRLPYSDFADILPEMNKAGYYSVECWGGATFDSCLRYLGEDPWQRLRDIRKAMPDTKLQMLLRGQNPLGYKHYHDDVVEKDVYKRQARLRPARQGPASAPRGAGCRGLQARRSCTGMSGLSLIHI